MIQAFALRHMKADDVRVSEGVNSNILRDGIEKPPRRIKVRMVKGDDALVRVWLIGEEEKIKEIADKKKKETEDKKKTKEAAKKAADAKKEEAKKAADAKKEAAKPASTAAAVGAQSPKATQAAPLAAKPK